MIATIANASVYDRHHFRRLRILLPPLLTSPYMIATKISVYYCHHFRRLRILSPYIASIYPLCISPPYMIVTTTDASVHILSPLPPTPAPHRRVYCAGVPHLPPNPAPHRRLVDCAGTWNSFKGKRKREVAVVHQYVETDPTNNYKWGSFANLPAIVSK